MNAPRFTIGGLLLLIAACGVGLAALVGESLWFRGLFTATIVAFRVAALGAMFRRGRVRAFCTGAVLCGSVYLLVVYDRNTCNLLLTDKFLRIAAEWAYSGWASPPPPTAPAAVQASYQEFNEAYLVNWNGTEPRSVFAAVGHLSSLGCSPWEADSSLAPSPLARGQGNLALPKEESAVRQT